MRRCRKPPYAEIADKEHSIIKRKVSDVVFEVAGIVVGLSASFFILLQVIAEWGEQESSLSLPFKLGFLLIYFFWILYGIKFKLVAISLTNISAFLLQLILIIVVAVK